MAFAAPAWPVWLVLPLAALYGATAIGWNGVQLAELARRAPAGQAGAVTGASGFVTFGGVVGGPLLFAGLAGLTGGYRTSFLVCAARQRRRRHRPDAPAESTDAPIGWKSFPSVGKLSPRSKPAATGQAREGSRARLRALPATTGVCGARARLRPPRFRQSAARACAVRQYRPRADA